MLPRRKRFSSWAWYGSMRVITWVETTCGRMRSSMLRPRRCEDDAARLPGPRPGWGVHLEHAKLALDDLRAGAGFGGLDGNIHHAEDFVARGHFDVQRRHALGRQVALGDRADKGRVLRLHAVQVTVTA